MKEREEEGRTDESHAQGPEGKEDQDRVRPPILTGHPPIIIPDGRLSFNTLDQEADSSTSGTNHEDIVVQFDGEGDHRHYTPENPPTYRASSLQRIDFIRVEDGSSHAHLCSNVPPDCLIEVTDKPRITGNASLIEIDARSGQEVVITFRQGGYSREHSAGKRKQLRGRAKKIKSLKVYDRAGALVHDCDQVNDGKDVRIVICDHACVG